MPSEVPPEVCAALDREWPWMRRVQIMGWAVVAAALAVVVLVGVSANAFVAGKGPGWPLLVALFVFLTVASLMSNSVRKTCQGYLLPAVAGTLGMSVTKAGHAFAKALPTGLLPGTRRSAADFALTGMTGEKDFCFAGVKVGPGGDEGYDFEGAVLDFRGTTPLPELVFAPDRHTGKARIGPARIPVEGLFWLRSVEVVGKTFDVWASSPASTDHPAFDTVLRRMTAVAGMPDISARLYSIMSEGTRFLVAIRVDRDLFRIGGLFATRSSVLSDLSRAHVDMQMPFRIAAVLLQAERDVVAAGQ